MELLLLLAGLGVLGYHAATKLSRYRDQATVQRQVQRLNVQQRQQQVARQIAARQLQARQQYARLNRLHARMQTGLLQLEDAPDFQRAASLAQQAHEVPVPYRQQQFVRFRMALVEHLVRRLTAREDEERLLTSLTTLVQALGMAGFEAEYVAAEARRRTVRPTRPEAVPYDEHLRQLQTDHDQRLTTLRSLVGLEEEMREQLIEAEQTRHREALLAAGNQPPQP